MGALLSYRIVDPQEATCFASGGRFRTALENAFGTLPAILDRKNIPVLNGMVACGFDDFQELIDAICEYGKVEVTVEY